MRARHQVRIIEKQFSTPGGTQNERFELIESIVDTLIEMGAPLDKNLFLVAGNGVCVSFAGENDILPNGSAGLFLASKEDNGFYLLAYAYGRTGPLYGNYYADSEGYLLFASTANFVSLSIHAVKSGDSFFYGFRPIGTGDSNYACICHAITPMKRLSDPNANLGYASVSGVFYGGPDQFIGGVINRTLPYIEGFDYKGGMYNFTTAGYSHSFPEPDTGNIYLIPYFSGFEDIYYDKVYISPVRRSETDEKAFETDRGVFLVGAINGYHYPADFGGYNALAFDITDAINGQ